jgi:hypothetical protein
MANTANIHAEINQKSQITEKSQKKKETEA